jgi:hypothetical protein
MKDESPRRGHNTAGAMREKFEDQQPISSRLTFQPIETNTDSSHIEPEIVRSKTERWRAP